MKKQDVLDYFKTPTRVARVLGYTIGAISNWPDIVPESSAQRLHMLTAGALNYDPVDYGREPLPSQPIPPTDSEAPHVRTA